MTRLTMLLSAALIGACVSDGPATPPEGAGKEVDSAVALIDSSIAPATAGEDGWNFEKSFVADVTGDGLADRVVITARVELHDGKLAWDDGQDWQAYVETGTGKRDYFFSQRLQLGTLAMRLAPRDSAGSMVILLIEDLPHRNRVFEASYPTPDQAPRVVLRRERMIDTGGEPLMPGDPGATRRHNQLPKAAGTASSVAT